MRKVAALAFVLCAGLTAGEIPLTGSEAVTIRVSPAVAREPASLQIIAMVEPDERNRTLDVTITSSGYATSSQMQLDGAQARRVWQTEFRDVPHGDYDVTATVTGATGRRASASRVVVVMR